MLWGHVLFCSVLFYVLNPSETKMAHLRKAAQDALAVQLRDNDAPTAFMHNAEAGYERLKEYVRGIRAAGIETLATKLAGGEASRALQEPPLSYLSEDSRFAHEAADAAHVGFNRKIFAEDDFAAKLLSSERFVDADGACHLLPEPNPVIIKESLESYCLIVEAVTRQGSKFVLDGTTLKYKGGWSKEGYQQVNLPSGTVFQCSEQQKVVFAVSKSEVRKFLQDYQLFWLMTHLNGFVESQIGADYSVSLDQLHTLFSFSVYTHFKYHNDQNDLSGDRRKNGVNLTVLVTISPGEASFHVAGRDKEVRYKFPGDIKAFHAGLYHRSGAAEFRTVKLAVFCRVFKREEVLFKKEAIDLTPDEVGSAHSIPTPPHLHLTSVLFCPVRPMTHRRRSSNRNRAGLARSPSLVLRRRPSPTKRTMTTAATLSTRKAQRMAKKKNHHRNAQARTTTRPPPMLTLAVKAATRTTMALFSGTCRLLPLQRRQALPAERRLSKFERNFDRIHVVLLWNRTCSGTEREGPRALLRTVRIAM